MRTRLALPVPFDSDASEPLLAPFEDAMQNEAAYIEEFEAVRAVAHPPSSDISALDG